MSEITTEIRAEMIMQTVDEISCNLWQLIIDPSGPYLRSTSESYGKPHNWEIRPTNEGGGFILEPATWGEHILLDYGELWLLREACPKYHPLLTMFFYGKI